MSARGLRLLLPVAISVVLAAQVGVVLCGTDVDVCEAAPQLPDVPRKLINHCERATALAGVCN